MLKTIILADDHVLLRNALATIINTFPGFNVINMAADGTELIEVIEGGDIPDIAILDLNMPKMDGFDTAKWLYKTHPGIKILILTMYDSEIALIRLLQVGVRGFLKKDIHPDELKNALLSVARDGFYYSHQITGKLSTLFKKNNGNRTSIEKAILSELEISFLKMAATELTYKEIAVSMKLTPRIIDNFRDALFDKLNVKSRVGLAIYAVKNGVVTF
ncbi:MAG: response regulator transcription factor [Ferruginibacter sp.]|nr:response regulator transcription factor [Ferruginibacter sp.]